MTDERKIEIANKILAANPDIEQEKLNYLINHWDDTDDYRDAGTIKTFDDMKRIYRDAFDPKKYEKYQNDKNKVRAAIKCYYDFEQVRIATGNRIVTSFNIQNGQEPSQKKEDMNDDMQKAIKLYEQEYQRITDAYVNNKATIKNIIKNNQGENTDLMLNFIKDDSDYKMINAYVETHKLEKDMEKVVKYALEGVPIYDEFLSKVKGCGPLMAGVIITYLDIYKAKYKSSFIKYVGIDTYYDEKKGKVVGTSMSRTEMVQYVDKNGEIKEKKSITYQPFLKTKLMGVLADLFIKTGSDYAVPYYEYKNRKVNDPRMEGESLAHINKMAKRYMMKIFLGDLFVKWKELEGLPVPQSYEERFLGMAPHHWNPLDEYKAANPEQFAKKEPKEKNPRGRKKKES